MDTIIGSMTALVTPFKNGKLDLEKYYIEELRSLVKGNRELQDKFYKDEFK